MPPKKNSSKATPAPEVTTASLQTMLASFFLRMGIAITFLYSAVASIFDPYAWIGFFPLWMRDLIPDTMLLGFHAGLGIVLTLWLISGKAIKMAAAIAAVWILGIFVFNIPQIDITFRDIAIFFSAIALAILNTEFKK